MGVFILAIGWGLGMGLDLIAALFAGAVFLYWVSSLKSSRKDFEIELNRPKNKIIVRNSKQLNPKSLIYPLDNFIGFGVSKAQSPLDSKHGAYGGLYFKFNHDVKSHEKASKNTLLHLAQKQVDEGQSFWKTPIQKLRYPVPLDNAVDIVDAVDTWLASEGTLINQVESTSIDAPIPDYEPEVLRDFRDVN